MQERGPSAYVAEFIGTTALVFFITAAVSLYVTAPTPTNPVPFIDFGVIGLVHVFVLFMLIQTLAVESGAHFNPAVTTAMVALRQISHADAAIYIVVQFAGGVAGALLTKALLLDEGRGVDYGAALVSDRIDGAIFPGMIVEGIGTFFLMWAIVGVAVNPQAAKDWAAFAIGATLGLVVMVLGPADRRRLQPCAFVRPGPRFRRVGRRRRVPAGVRGRAGDRSAGGGRWRTTASTSRRARRAQEVWGPWGDAHGVMAAGSARSYTLPRAAGHLLAQLHAVAVADVSVLLQVLRVRHAQGASVLAAGRGAPARRGRAAQHEGALGAHWGAPRGQPRGGGAARGLRALRTSRRMWSGSASARWSAACCRTRTSGVLSRDDLARLREVTASQGLMLESVNPSLEAHRGSPTKHPDRRLETIRAAGELRIPFTSGILVGIGESPDERVAALDALAAVHREHGHLQEVILQNFVPHERYYGAEPAEIADRAQREGARGRCRADARSGGAR